LLRKKLNKILNSIDGNLFRPGDSVKREFLGSDEIPETLIPILKRVVNDFIEPILEPAAVQMKEYAAKNPAGGKMPKPLMGKVPITVRIGENHVTRLNNPFDLYRLEKAQKIIHDFELDDFVNEIDPTGSIARCRFDEFNLARVKNHLHMIPK